MKLLDQQENKDDTILEMFRLELRLQMKKTICFILFIALSAFAQTTRSPEIQTEPAIETVKGVDSDITIYSFVPAGSIKRTTIIMLAGGDGAKMIGRISPIHFQFAEQMNGYGYAVYAIDYRNVNRKFMDDRWIDDIEIGIDRIKHDEAVDTNNIFLAGFSMGGTNAMRYAVRSGNVRGLILYASPMKFKKAGLVRIIGEDRMPIRLVARLSAPVIFFQGRDDIITRPGQSEEFIDTLKAQGKQVEYHEYENTKHCFTYVGTKGDRVEYNESSAYDSYRKVNEFILKWNRKD